MTWTRSSLPSRIVSSIASSMHLVLDLNNAHRRSYLGGRDGCTSSKTSILTPYLSLANSLLPPVPVWPFLVSKLHPLSGELCPLFLGWNHVFSQSNPHKFVTPLGLLKCLSLHCLHQVVPMLPKKVATLVAAFPLYRLHSHRNTKTSRCNRRSPSRNRRNH